MTAPADRFKGWIDGLAEDWKVRLHGWLVSFFSVGLDTFFKILGKSAAPKLRPLIDLIEATGKVSPELQPVLDELKNPTGEMAAMFAQSAGGSLFGGAFGKIIDAVLLPIAYAVNSKTQNVILGETQYLALWLRGEIDDEVFKEKMNWTGHDDTDIAHLKMLTKVRFDPSAWITAFRRKYEDFDTIENDLKEQGWDDNRIAALKFITEFVPPEAQQTLWLAREVYEPNMVSKYGLHDEMPNYADTDFAKVGVSPDQMKNIWAAHWEHASFVQMVEMLHRGLITEADFSEWFKLVEVVPFWRDKLIQTVYAWPTRVDVRRWWDMRIIPEERLRELYKGMGYRGQNLEDYIIWTKVYTDFPMMIARFKNGWITEDDIRTWLLSVGVPEERAQQFIEEKTKPEAAARVEPERQATATEIMKAVKKEIISWAEGIERLGRLGYNAEEAEFKLKVYIGVSEGSPDTYMEFVDWTESYRKSIGLDANKPSEELIQAERDMTAAKANLDREKAEGAKADQLAPFEKAVSDSTYYYRQLLIQWKKTKP